MCALVVETAEGGKAEVGVRNVPVVVLVEVSEMDRLSGRVKNAGCCAVGVGTGVTDDWDEGVGGSVEVVLRLGGDLAGSGWTSECEGEYEPLLHHSPSRLKALLLTPDYSSI